MYTLGIFISASLSLHIIIMLSIHRYIHCYPSVRSFNSWSHPVCTFPLLEASLGVELCPSDGGTGFTIACGVYIRTCKAGDVWGTEVLLEGGRGAMPTPFPASTQARQYPERNEIGQYSSTKKHLRPPIRSGTSVWPQE